MAARDKERREQQKKQYEQHLEQRKTALREKGAEEQTIARDSMVKRLQADIRRTERAISSIEKNQKIMEDARSRKEENARRKAEHGSKKKQKEAEPAKESKEGKKKKKKKQ